jgi:hypothetical protein
MEWKHPHLRTQKSNPRPLQVNYGALFLNCNGPVEDNYIEQGTTITASSYTEIFKSKLKPAIRNKRRGLLAKVVLLLYNNACPHSAAVAIEAIRQLKAELFPHPNTVRT